MTLLFSKVTPGSLPKVIAEGCTSGAARRSMIAVLAIAILVPILLLAGCKSLDAEEASTTVVVTGHSVRPEPLPVWNIWTQQTSELDSQGINSAYALTTVRENQRFALVINMSSAALSSQIASRPISKELSDAILNSKNKKVRIDIVAIPDKRAVRSDSTALSPAHIIVDVEKYRAQVRNHTQGEPGDSHSALAIEARNPVFSLGQTTIFLRSTAKTGMTHVALSFWVDERPVDEMSVPVCISSETTSGCATKAKVIRSSMGSLGQAQLKSPDASLHLLNLDEESFVGVFYCARCGASQQPRYHTWQSPLSRERFFTALETQVIPAFQAAVLADPRVAERTVTNQYRAAGKLLFEIIFRSVGEGAGPSSVESEFIAFVKRAVDLRGAKAPLLYTRMFSSRSDSVLLPMNFMLVTFEDRSDAFLGFSVNVESFLNDVLVSPPQQCVGRLASLLPTTSDDVPLRAARLALGDWASRLNQPSFGSEVVESRDIARFAEWLDRDEHDSSGLGVITLTHNFENKLCFSSETCEEIGNIYAMAINRTFADPSFAILNGCGTVGTESAELLEAFSDRGMNTVIGTSAIVKGDIGGHFLRLFLETLHQNAANPAYSISDARFDAVKSLRDVVGRDNDRPYGAAALNFALAGNGTIRICVPPVLSDRTTED